MTVATRRAAMTVDEIRAAYGDVVRAADAAPEAIAWRLSRFERGLKLAGEIELRIGPLDGLRVLDVGAAHGGDAAAFFAHGASVTAADMYDHDYAALKARIAEDDDQFEFQLFDGTQDWPLPDASYDVVISLGLLEMIEDRARFFDELLRVLRPGGIGVVYTGTAVRMLKCDPLFRLPLLSLLPTPWRRWIAERVFGRRYRFPLARHMYYTCRPLRRFVRPHGYDVVPAKYARSPVMRKLGRWPGGALWQEIVRELAYDFVLIVPGSQAHETRWRSPSPADSD